MSAPTPTPIASEYISRDELARVLHKHPRTLANWALRRKGPRPIRVGTTCLYRVEAVREWLASLEQPEGEYARR